MGKKTRKRGLKTSLFYVNSLAFNTRQMAGLLNIYKLYRLQIILFFHKLHLSKEQFLKIIFLV